MQHSPLLTQYLAKLQSLTLDTQSSVLDLACGSGRNGLYLASNDVPVSFADINNEALLQVKQALAGLPKNQQTLTHCKQVDLEQAGIDPLQGQSYAGVMVFHYLHRPLFDHIKAAIKPSGMVIYETFTEQQTQFGRPKNPDFLLKSGELLSLFDDWQVLHSFEGVVITDEENGTKKAIAQIVAIKPN